MGTAAVAAIILRKEEDVVEHFRQARALARESARTLDELMVEDGIALRRLQQRAVIREGAPGAYYFDEPTWIALRTTRRRVVLILLALVVLTAGTLAATFLSNRPAS